MITAERLRAVAEEAAHRAGAYLHGVFRRDMRAETKRDRHDLVTEHDRAAERIITRFLLAEDPSWRVIGEEYGAQGGESDVVWHVDPIDGTSNFAQGLAFFCVSIGVEVAGRLVAGVILDPIAGTRYSADDRGAFLDGAPLRTPTAQPAGAATLITGYPTARDLDREGRDALVDFGDLVDAFSSVRRTGSGALQLAHVAAGWTDAAFGTQVSSWDVAAGALIVRRAGGSYRPLWFGEDPGSHGDHCAPGFVATAPGAQYPALDRTIAAVAQRRSRATVAV